MMTLIHYLLKVIKPLFCDHHYEGGVFNGSGGSHIYCKKCGYDHYGKFSDHATQKAIKKVNIEKLSN